MNGDFNEFSVALSPGVSWETVSNDNNSFLFTLLTFVRLLLVSTYGVRFDCGWMPWTAWDGVFINTSGTRLQKTYLCVKFSYCTALLSNLEQFGVALLLYSETQLDWPCVRKLSGLANMDEKTFSRLLFTDLILLLLLLVVVVVYADCLPIPFITRVLSL